METAINYPQNKSNNSRHLLKTLLHYHVKHRSLKNLHLLYQFLITKLCRTIMITFWIINWFEKHLCESGTLLHCFNDRSLDMHTVRGQNVLLWPVRRHEDALSINCAINCTLLKARAKYPTVPQLRKLVTGTRAAGQGSK